MACDYSKIDYYRDFKKDLEDNQVKSPPKGLSEIIQTFGYPPEDINKRYEWEKQNLIYIPLLKPIPASWNKKEKINKLRIHKKLAYVFAETLNDLFTFAEDYIEDIGGTYYYRTKKSSKYKLSTHSWGIAIDINVNKNPYGKKPNMENKIIKIFKAYNWIWGGFWTIPDGMHFQFAEKY